MGRSITVHTPLTLILDTRDSTLDFLRPVFFSNPLNHPIKPSDLCFSTTEIVFLLTCSFYSNKRTCWPRISFTDRARHTEAWTWYLSVVRATTPPLSTVTMAMEPRAEASLCIIVPLAICHVNRQKADTARRRMRSEAVICSTIFKLLLVLTLWN